MSRHNTEITLHTRSRAGAAGMAPADWTADSTRTNPRASIVCCRRYAVVAGVTAGLGLSRRSRVRRIQQRSAATTVVTLIVVGFSASACTTPARLTRSPTYATAVAQQTGSDLGL